MVRIDRPECFCGVEYGARHHLLVFRWLVHAPRRSGDIRSTDEFADVRANNCQYYTDSGRSADEYTGSNTESGAILADTKTQRRQLKFLRPRSLLGRKCHF